MSRPIVTVVAVAALVGVVAIGGSLVTRSSVPPLQAGSLAVVVDAGSKWKPDPRGTGEGEEVVTVQQQAPVRDAGHGEPTTWDSPGTTIVALHRSQCFGDCPVYSVSLTGDGSVLWFGEDHVAVSGFRRGSTSSAAVDALAAKILKTGFGPHLIRPTDVSRATVLVRSRGRVAISEPSTEIDAWIDAATHSSAWIGAPKKNGSTKATEPLAMRTVASILRGELGTLQKKCGKNISLTIDEQGRVTAGDAAAGRPEPPCGAPLVATWQFPLIGLDVAFDASNASGNSASGAESLARKQLDDALR